METNFEIVNKQTGEVTPVLAYGFELHNKVSVTTPNGVMEFEQDAESGKIFHSDYDFLAKGTEGQGNVLSSVGEDETVVAPEAPVVPEEVVAPTETPVDTPVQETVDNNVVSEETLG